MYLRFYCECRIPTYQSPFFHPGDGKDICFFIQKSSLIAQNEENNEENQFQPRITRERICSKQAENPSHENMVRKQ
jgi:hypothetical protein